MHRGAQESRVRAEFSQLGLVAANGGQGFSRTFLVGEGIGWGTAAGTAGGHKLGTAEWVRAGVLPVRGGIVVGAAPLKAQGVLLTTISLSQKGALLFEVLYSAMKRAKV